MPSKVAVSNKLHDIMFADSMSIKATDSIILITDNDPEQFAAVTSLAHMSGGQRDLLADTLKDYYESLLDDPRPEGGNGFERLMVIQMFTEMLNSVVWLSVADHYLDKVKEGA